MHLHLIIVADLNAIRIGAYTNIQDRAVILTGKDNPHGLSAAVEIGDYVTIGMSNF
jgi:carbonic anhydrase/acetyltransferase-like protein (isoleucine patch superfamily)